MTCGLLGMTPVSRCQTSRLLLLLDVGKQMPESNRPRTRPGLFGGTQAQVGTFGSVEARVGHFTSVWFMATMEFQPLRQKKFPRRTFFNFNYNFQITSSSKNANLFNC